VEPLGGVSKLEDLPVPKECLVVVEECVVSHG
jgi:hypothetical protein